MARNCALQAGRLKGALPVAVVDVERPALSPCRGRGFRLMDLGRDAVDVQDGGRRESAEPCANDRYGVHDASLVSGGGAPHQPIWCTDLKWNDTPRWFTALIWYGAPNESYLGHANTSTPDSAA
ncbi:hypothetical protein GCM10009647_082770 [Streptomyces sanglieri]